MTEAPKGDASKEPQLKSLEAPIILERNFLIGGKRITVHVTFPAQLGKEIGLENVYVCAQRLLVKAEGKGVAVKELRLGE
jgi:hypothetical protein